MAFYIKYLVIKLEIQIVVNNHKKRNITGVQLNICARQDAQSSRTIMIENFNSFNNFR